jgi:hypothetical protein
MDSTGVPASLLPVDSALVKEAPLARDEGKAKEEKQRAKATAADKAVYRVVLEKWGKADASPGLD